MELLQPPPFFWKCPKESPKKTTPNFWIRVGPPPPFGKCPKGSSFFFGITSLRWVIWQNRRYYASRRRAAASISVVVNSKCKIHLWLLVHNIYTCPSSVKESLRQGTRSIKIAAFPFISTTDNLTNHFLIVPPRGGQDQFLENEASRGEKWTEKCKQDWIWDEKWETRRNSRQEMGVNGKRGESRQ